MKAQGVFGVLRQLVLVSLLCHLARGMNGKPGKVTQGTCSDYEGCDECARNDKCMWCEAESELGTKCQRHSDPCPGEKIKWNIQCKDYCDLSPCESCVQQNHCNWCIYDSTCRTEMQDGNCEFGIVNRNDVGNEYQNDWQQSFDQTTQRSCYLANGFPTFPNKKEALKQWEKLEQLRYQHKEHLLKQQRSRKSYNSNSMVSLWFSAGAIGLAIGFVIWATCMCCRCCFCKKRNATPSNGKDQLSAVTEVGDVIQEPVRQRSNHFVPPANPIQFQQKRPQPKTGNTTKDGVCIYLSPVVGSDNESTDENIYPKETSMINKHSEGRPESREKPKKSRKKVSNSEKFSFQK